MPGLQEVAAPAVRDAPVENVDVDVGEGQEPPGKIGQVDDPGEHADAHTVQIMDPALSA